MLRVTLCRGCCCGILSKPPGADYDAQCLALDELAARGLITWRQTDCLEPCGRANVLVVQPTPEARNRGARPVWLGQIGNHQLDAIAHRVANGGPGISPLPANLEAHLINPRNQ